MLVLAHPQRVPGRLLVDAAVDALVLPSASVVVWRVRDVFEHLRALVPVRFLVEVLHRMQAAV